jgi:hypothetical protein
LLTRPETRGYRSPYSRLECAINRCRTRHGHIALRRHRRTIYLLLLLVGGTVANLVAATDEPIVFEVKPSDADPTIRRFNEPNYIVLKPNSTAQDDLVVFLPGTLGRPRNSMQLLGFLAGQGYRVIGLAYNDDPAVVQLCPRNPSPSCSGAVREKRIFGSNVTNVVDNMPGEAIVARLVALLMYLDQHDSNRLWGTYLRGNEPNWERIVISGLSQGAGMAAYIAKRKRVARVVLFSSPWDFQGARRTLAPWLFEPSETPPERWFAEYHRREKTASLIAHAYGALGIPADHVRVFDLDPSPTLRAGTADPYHLSTVRNQGYSKDWAFMFGHVP